MATKTRKKYTPEAKKHYANMFIVEHKKTNITQTEFAKKHNLGRKTLSNWLGDNKDYTGKHTNAKYTSKQNIEYYLNLFKQERKKTNISKKDFANKHAISAYTFTTWVRENPHILTMEKLTQQSKEINHLRKELYRQLKSEYIQLVKKIDTVQRHIGTISNKKISELQINAIYNFI